MPQLDQTGPQGMGPKTGRGMGTCNSGIGYGRGRRGCCGRFYNPSKAEEKETILREMEDTKEYIKSMEARLEEITKEEE
ncbi:MAG: DUF5320 domain-containing protein [Candidatus Paceibacterota bacterium]